MRTTSALIAAAIAIPGCGIEVGVGENLPDDEPDVPAPIDRDQDGYSVFEDCDDFDAAIAPGERETCDGKDNDCDQRVDIDPVSEVHVCAWNDDFTQGLKADVLFVFDVSQSMTPYHERVAQGAVTFLREVVGPAHDTHVGVLTMDMHHATQRGRLVQAALPHGSARWIQGDAVTIDAAAWWLTSAILDTEIQLSGDEGGRAVVDRAILEADAANAGFFRSDADLVVVFVTNEEDKTPYPTVPELLDTLDSFKGSRSKVTVHSVVQLDDYDCDAQLSPTTYGASYVDLAGLTSGTTMSVCESDYDQYLATLGQITATQGLENRFPLSQPAQDPTSTQVKVVLPGGTQRILDYDEGDYALIDGNSTLLLLLDPLPPPGSQILVDYLRDY